MTATFQSNAFQGSAFAIEPKPAFQSGAFQINAFQIQIQTVTETINFMQLPVNCVMAGNQPEEKKSKIVTDFHGVLKSIFRE